MVNHWFSPKRRIDELITLPAHEVQKQLDQPYGALGSQPCNGWMDQAGLRDGSKIVQDDIDHSEFGFALEHVLYLFEESGVPISTGSRSSLEEAVSRMGKPAGLPDRVSAIRGQD